MLIEIFDVDHGFCALISADDGQHVLLDCGRNALSGLSPSGVLHARGIRTLDALIISHADEDHVSDLPELMRDVFVRSVITNDSLDSYTLQRIKEATAEGIGPGAQTVIWRKNRFFASLIGGDPYPNLPGAEIVFYRNRYPWFGDLNNLSLVTFLHYGNIHAVFPGDLETAGWRALLQDPGFCVQLSRVNVFIASHHGRENGFCAEVFGFCSPEVVIISDSSLKYASQEMTDRYADQALGVFFGLERRKVLTTRCDGSIYLWESLAEQTGGWVATARSLQRVLPRSRVLLP